MDILDAENSSYLPDLSSTSPSCLDSNSNITDCITEEVKEWLENEVVGMRVWQLVSLIIPVVTTILIMLCCCVRFRIPRTKQEIEADFIRKKLTKSFRKELNKINDKEMDEMDLKKALDFIRDGFDTKGLRFYEESHPQEKKVLCEKKHAGIGRKFNVLFHGIRIRFNKDEPASCNSNI